MSVMEGWERHCTGTTKRRGQLPSSRREDGGDAGLDSRLTTGRGT